MHYKLPKHSFDFAQEFRGIVLHHVIGYRLQADNRNGPEPDTISYLIKNGATVKEVQVEMGERMAGQSYLTFWRSVQYMVKMSISILLIQWFRKRDTETPYPERSL